jgi:hypothetical protein
MYRSQARTNLAVSKHEAFEADLWNQLIVRKPVVQVCPSALTAFRAGESCFVYYGKHLAIGGPNNCVRPSGILFQSQIAARYRGFSGFSCKTFSPEGIQ